MIKNIYFHLEMGEGTELELAKSAYKENILQIQKDSLRQLKCYKVLDKGQEISRGLLGELYKSTYGSPIGKNSRVTVDEIKAVKDIEIGILNMEEASKIMELEDVIDSVSRYLSGYGLTIRDTEHYRVVVEIEK